MTPLPPKNARPLDEVDLRLLALLQRDAAVSRFSGAIARHPAVLNVYFVSGSYDFLLHVACSGPEDLRDFIATELSGKLQVAGTETHLIFEHTRGASSGE